MKRLLLLRHAKSSWKHASLDDHDRPLTARGEKSARRMGRYLRDEGLIPDGVLCSTAVRALRTWDVVAARLGREVPMTLLPEIYTADAAGLLRIVRGAADDATMLLIGHNPALQELTLTLAGSGAAAALASVRRKFPTASLAVVRFDIEDWAAVAPESGELERFVRAKQLQS